MGINKVQYGNTTLIDLTADTVTAATLLEGYTAHDRSGAIITGTAHEGGDVPVWQGSDDYVYFSDTVTPPYEISMIDGYVVIDLPPAVLQTKTRTYTPTTSQQTDVITADVGYDGLEEVDITVNAIQTETKSATPSETAQTITPTSGKYLSSVSVGAIDSNYVGSGITQRSSASLTTSGATVTAPSGYYASNASATVASGTAGTPTATKGAVSNHSVSVTPSVTNTTGYIDGGTKTGTAVSVSASELVSGNLSITENGTGINVANYSTVSVAVSPTLITKNITENGTYNASSDSADGYSSVTVNVSGGGGLVYETGTWTPSSDVASYVISFTNTHTVAPFFYMISDSTGTYSDVLNSNYATVYYNSHQLTGMEMYASTTSYWYGSVHIIARASSTTAFTDAFFSLTTPYTSSSSSSTSNSRYWATETGIKAISNSTSRLWRAGRTYNWIAVWTPTT